MNAEFSPGDRIGDRYEIEEPLGKGGFAQVYRGIQLGMNRPVAIKIMAPNLEGIKASNHEAALQDFSRRFEKEAQVLSTLHDPSTVTVHDYGVSDSGIPYMILELVQGTSLDRLDGSQLPMAQHRVVKVMMRVLESLREAHFLSILHRDIKPSNIMIFEHMGERDRVKVLDFGMAKIYEGKTDLSQETQQSILIGTPRYMAPELIREPEKAGPASDLYSLGLICVELLTGKRAIAETETMLQISRQIDEHSIKLPEHLDVLPELRAIVDKMIEKDLAARWHDAQHIINALNQRVIPKLPSVPQPEVQAPAPKPKRPDNPLLKSLSFNLPPKPSLDRAKHPSIELDEDDASTITLTEEAMVETMTTTRTAGAKVADDARIFEETVKAPVVIPDESNLFDDLFDDTAKAPSPVDDTGGLFDDMTRTPAPIADSASLFEPDAASPSPSGIRMPERPVLQSGLLPPPPAHSVARPLRAETVSQPIDVLQDERLRKRVDSSHNVAAPLDPLPLSWDENEVTPPPAQPDKAQRVIVLDSPSGRHPVSTGPAQPVSPRPAQPSQPMPTPEQSAMLQVQELDKRMMAIQRRNQMLSALLLLVVLGATLYVIVQYLL